MCHQFLPIDRYNRYQSNQIYRFLIDWLLRVSLLARPLNLTQNEQEEILLLPYHALNADRRPRIADAWINYHQGERCAKTAVVVWWCHDHCFCSLLASLGSNLSRAEKNAALICATCKNTHRIKVLCANYRWTRSLTWDHALLLLFFNASLLLWPERKKKTEIKGKGMIAGYVVLERGNPQLKNGDK